MMGDAALRLTGTQHRRYVVLPGAIVNTNIGSSASQSPEHAVGHAGFQAPIRILLAEMPNKVAVKNRWTGPRAHWIRWRPASAVCVACAANDPYVSYRLPSFEGEFSARRPGDAILASCRTCHRALRIAR